MAKFIINVVCRYSDAKVIIIDQGREFCKAVNDDICRHLRIDILELIIIALPPTILSQMVRLNVTTRHSATPW